MNFLNRLFGKDGSPRRDRNKEFWSWFCEKERAFFDILQLGDKVDEQFVSVLMDRLQDLNGQFYCQVGMFSDDTAELIVTAEGDVKTFVFVERLIAAAPNLDRWKFTAHKQPDSGSGIEMRGFRFNREKLRFFSNDDPDYPDEIDLVVVYDDFKEEDKDTIRSGALIYLDTFLGELNLATIVDNCVITGEVPSGKQPIPIESLPAYLLWRQKEFVEKYHETIQDTSTHRYDALEGKDTQGLPLVAIVNRDLLEWDGQASHPWMTLIDIAYTVSNNGMPDQKSVEYMNAFEDDLAKRLPERVGYLNIGRKTHNGHRRIYLACKEFRSVSEQVAALIDGYSDRLTVSYDIIKDKYWMMVDEFRD